MDQGLPRWTLLIMIGVVAVALLATLRFDSGSDKTIPFTRFRDDVASGLVKEVNWNNVDSTITGTYNDGQTFTTVGPPNADNDTVNAISSKTKLTFKAPENSILGPILQMALMIGLFAAVFIWI